MYFCNNYALAVLFCIVTMLCWGSWGNTQKLAGRTWRYELFYWDYVIGVVLFALANGLTAGSWGGGEWSFVINLKQASAANLGSAFLGVLTLICRSEGFCILLNFIKNISQAEKTV